MRGEYVTHGVRSPDLLYMHVNKARAVTARIIDMDDINFDIYTGPWRTQDGRARVLYAIPRVYLPPSRPDEQIHESSFYESLSRPPRLI